MIFPDYHTHTVFSDGKNTPGEMVQAALAMGMPQIGFSDHSYTWFDESYCIPKDRLPEYRQTILDLKRQYAGKIDIFCGIEQDFYSEEPTDGYDYVIGSVHYLRCGQVFVPVDESAACQQEAVEQYFGGDPYAMVECYFETVAQVIEKTNADIIGHFDLISKFSLFDENHPRYVAAAQKAMDALLQTGKPFEINTGAISRGYRTDAYPARPLRDYLRQRGGRFLLSGDSHAASTLCFHFEDYQDYVFGVPQSPCI